MKALLQSFSFCAFICLSLGSETSAAEKAVAKPNIIFFLTDDQGYGDLGCFGAEEIATPRIDQLCREGMKYTSFYATNRCSPTRLAFMTGSLPQRAGWDKVIYRNDSEAGLIKVALKGLGGNRNGEGAKVEVEIADNDLKALVGTFQSAVELQGGSFSSSMVVFTELVPDLSGNLEMARNLVDSMDRETMAPGASASQLALTIEDKEERARWIDSLSDPEVRDEVLQSVSGQ